MRTGLVLVGFALASALEHAPGRDKAFPPQSTNLPSSSVAGTVITDTETGSPVSRAIVSISGPTLTAPRSVVTAEDGRFVLNSLPAGRYSVKAEKAAFITSEYGAKRPGRRGVEVNIGEGVTVNGLTIRLARGAVIAGTLRDSAGAPLSSVSVRLISTKGSARNEFYFSLTNNGVRTNQLGEYRIFGLEPGSYLVQAQQPVSEGSVSILTEERIDRILAHLADPTGKTLVRSSDSPVSSEAVTYTPVYYPGTPDPSAATIITLASGEERLGLDFSVGAVPAAAVQGMVILEDGRPAAGASVFLRRARSGVVEFPTPSAVVADKNGQFLISNATSGNYRLFARYRDARQPQPGFAEAQSATAAGRWASMDVAVAGADIGGVRLNIRTGVTLMGRVVFHPSRLSANASLPDPSGASLILRSDDWGIATTTSVRGDGSFLVSGLPAGRYRLEVAGERFPGWLPASAIVNESDLLDVPTELIEGAPQQVVVTYIDNPGELAGRLATADQRGVSDVFILAFSSDSRFWTAPRRTRAVRPATDGSFVFRDLVPGSYYLAALVDVDSGDWLQPNYLESLISSSVKVEVKAGTHIVQNLRIGRFLN